MFGNFETEIKNIKTKKNETLRSILHFIFNTFVLLTTAEKVENRRYALVFIFV